MQRSQLELIGIEYYSIPIQEKHWVCQVGMVLKEICEDACNKYILEKWQFVRTIRAIVDHVHSGD